MDFTSIDHASPEQLYLQIRKILVTAIQERRLLPGQQVPSATSIARQAGVSRMTARHAMDALVKEGWIYTVPGKGSFVAEKAQVVLDMRYLLGWSEELTMQGVQPASTLVAAEVVPAEARIARELNVAEKTALHCIVRVQSAKDIPLSLDTTYVVHDRFPGLADFVKANPASVSQILRKEYGVQLVRGVQFVEATGADQHQAHLLHITQDSPVLLVERTTYTVGDIPIQFVQSLHRSGLVRFKTELTSTLPNYDA